MYEATDGVYCAKEPLQVELSHREELANRGPVDNEEIKGNGISPGSVGCVDGCDDGCDDG